MAHPLGQSSSSAVAPLLSTADNSVVDDEANVEGAAEGIFGEDEDDVALVDNDLGVLEDMMADLLAEMEGGDADAILAADLGAQEPDAAATEQISGETSGANAEEAPLAEVDAACPELVEVVEAVAASRIDGGPAPSAAASSSTDPQPEAAVADDGFPESGFLISQLGYVRCNRPGHDPERVIGLVGEKRDGKSVFANCHLHSTCSISVGVMRRDVSQDYLAAWLCAGQVAPEGATTAQRKALGVDHRKLWVRPP